MEGQFPCPYCPRVCKSERGLRQHINRTNKCLKKELAALKFGAREQDNPEPDNPNQDATVRDEIPPAREARASRQPNLQSNAATDSMPHGSEFVIESVSDQLGRSKFMMDAVADPVSESSTFEPILGSTSEDTKESGNEADPGLDDDDDGNGSMVPNTEMIMQFREYCRTHNANFLPLNKQRATSIKLLDVLKRKKCPLNAYKEAMEWHLKEHLDWFEDNYTLAHTRDYVTRGTLIKELEKRYNMDAMHPKSKTISLPFSGAKVTIPYRDASDCLVSLLMDPRLDDENYIFYNQDPLSPPPQKVPYLADLHTGDAYLKSYEKMITKKNQVLLPCPMYIDGAVTGQFSNLPITTLKIGLGIVNRETRDKSWAWRELVFVPQVRKEMSRGKKMFKDSKHMEANDIVLIDGEGDTGSEASEEDTDNESTDEDMQVKAQDFHTMLHFILKSFVKLQQTGFIWDLVYKGKTYKNVEFIPFVSFCEM